MSADTDPHRKLLDRIAVTVPLFDKLEAALRGNGDTAAAWRELLEAQEVVVHAAREANAALAAELAQTARQ
jgi:hypothetical protein